MTWIRDIRWIKWNDFLFATMSVKYGKFGQYVTDSNGRFVIPPYSPQLKRNGKFVSKQCKKCNHPNNTHIRYGKTDWYYCRICLRLKINSECT